jgi:hypothetical protein
MKPSKEVVCSNVEYNMAIRDRIESNENVLQDFYKQKRRRPRLNKSKTRINLNL